MKYKIGDWVVFPNRPCKEGEIVEINESEKIYFIRSIKIFNNFVLKFPWWNWYLEKELLLL